MGFVLVLVSGQNIKNNDFVLSFFIYPFESPCVAIF